MSLVKLLGHLNLDMKSWSLRGDELKETDQDIFGYGPQSQKQPELRGSKSCIKDRGPPRTRDRTLGHRIHRRAQGWQEGRQTGSRSTLRGKSCSEVQLCQRPETIGSKVRLKAAIFEMPLSQSRRTRLEKPECID